LYQDYWQPVYGFVRRRGGSPEEAEDLCQEFFLDLITRNALEGLRPELGRFRCFLVAALRNFLANAWDRARTMKRGGGIVHVGLDADEAGSGHAAEDRGPSLEVAFDREWAWTVVGRVLGQLKAEYETAGRGRLFEELRGFLGDSTESRSHAEVAREHGITVNAVGVAIHRLRRRFGELLRNEVSRTVADAGEVRDEIRHLLANLSDPGMGA
jgi:RNA polymerase sigma factor (sigma-70 family)